MFRVESPLTAIPFSSEAPIELPESGSLLRAVAHADIDFETAIVLPAEYFGTQQAPPTIPLSKRGPFELMQLAQAHEWWTDADVRGNLFALAQRDRVLETITSALVSLVCGPRWAALERRMLRTGDFEDYVDEMRQLVGDSAKHQRLARAIGNSLFAWADPVQLLTGFTEAIGQAATASGIVNPSAPYFLLTLASHPSGILEWDRVARGVLLRDILNAPVLLQAARFAVLGVRAFNDPVGKRNDPA
jgi:hypothetical protein